MDEVKFASIAAPLPADSRYRALLRRVLERLPDGWNEFRTVGVELGEGKPQGYACALRYEALEDEEDLDEPRSEQTWVVTLYPEWLDSFDDGTVLWVIAHELGHVASGCRCESLVFDAGARAVSEQMADAIARAWGFWQEEEAFEEATSKEAYKDAPGRWERRRGEGATPMTTLGIPRPSSSPAFSPSSSSPRPRQI